MADTKITQLQPPQLGYPVVPATDVLPIVVIADPGMATSGSTRKVTVNQLLGAGGTATLASATITGAATVGTTLGVTGVSTFAAGTALLPALTTTGDTNTGIYYPAADTFAVTTGGAERYRVDSSGNVGVGLTPRVKLDVNGGLLVNNYGTSSNYAPLSVTTASTITTPSTFTNAINIWNPTTVGAYSNITFGYNALGLTNAPAYIGFVSTTSTSGGFGDLVFGTRSVGTDTAATERVRIDSSGNVGVGVTPSAWGSSLKAFEIGAKGNALFTTTSVVDGLFMVNNAYYDTAYKYAANGYASRYTHYQGAHQWFTAASGTAGNAITFTQAMTLDASGNLILLSPSTPPTLATNGQLTVNATSNTNLRFSYRGSDGTTRVANITLA